MGSFGSVFRFATGVFVVAASFVFVVAESGAGDDVAEAEEGDSPTGGGDDGADVDGGAHEGDIVRTRSTYFFFAPALESDSYFFQPSHFARPTGSKNPGREDRTGPSVACLNRPYTLAF